MIRPATIDDIPKLMELGQRHYDESGYDGIIPFDADSAEQSLRDLMDSDDAILLVMCEPEIVGMIGGATRTSWINRNHKIAAHLVWWVEPAYRRTIAAADLLFQFMEWASGTGARTLCMGGIHGSPPSRLYERLGFVKMEQIYGKALTYGH